MPCNKCVENYDHHCSWLNNCIGKRNYKPFFRLLICFISYLCFNLYLSSRGFGFVKETGTYVLIGSCIMNSIMLISVGMLLIFHLNLYRLKMTTYDYIRSRHQKATKSQVKIESWRYED